MNPEQARAAAIRAELHGKVDKAEKALAAEREAREKAEKDRDKFRQWVHDCQAGMYINCVYCGHRYGPDDEVPATMANVLKEHIEQCPDHPMSALKKALAAEREAREKAEKERDKARAAILWHTAFCADTHELLARAGIKARQPSGGTMSVEDEIARIMGDVPPEELAKLPTDLAQQYLDGKSTARAEGGAMSVQRWEFQAYNMTHGYGSMSPLDDGEWISFEAHEADKKAALAAERARAEKAEKELEEARRMHRVFLDNAKDKQVYCENEAMRAHARREKAEQERDTLRARLERSGNDRAALLADNESLRTGHVALKCEHERIKARLKALSDTGTTVEVRPKENP